MRACAHTAIGMEGLMITATRKMVMEEERERRMEEMVKEWSGGRWEIGFTHRKVAGSVTSLTSQ